MAPHNLYDRTLLAPEDRFGTPTLVVPNYIPQILICEN